MTGLIVEASLPEGFALPIASGQIEDAVLSVLRAEGVNAAELSIALVPDEQIAGMNEQYLAHEGPTDVISFPLHQPGGAPLGDVYIGFEQALRQAKDSGVSPREEILRLAVHGTLHVLGYEHPEGPDRSASPMYHRQEALLASFLASTADD